MNRNLTKVAPFTYGLLGLGTPHQAPDEITEDSIAYKEVQAAKASTTPWERIKLMYTIDEFGYISPELNSIRQAGFLGLMVGAIYGGFVDSRIAYMNFMERNQATAFEHHFEAKKKLQDNVTLGFAKGAWKWSWRLALFTTSYTAITTTISSYRGKSSLYEYLAAGGVTGAMYKFNMGLRGMAAGTFFGSIIGGLAGLGSLAILKLTGTSMEDIRYWQYAWKQQRSQVEKEVWHGEVTVSPLLMDHEDRMGKNVHTLDSLDSQLKKIEDKIKKQESSTPAK